MSDSTPRKTALANVHVAHGGRLVDFAGWSLPVQFPAGIIEEVRHCRRAAALFDVSHMRQIDVRGAGAEAALEALMPADLRELAAGRQRYTQLLNNQGGIIDDLMVGRIGDAWRLVVNATRGAVDLAHLRAFLPMCVEVVERDDLALLSLQGPLAATVLERHSPGVGALPFMGLASVDLAGVPGLIARCGYTGEDGFEIALPAGAAAGFAEALLGEREVALAGLGARDALRLEAGLCLYGQDIDETTTPVEAGLAWSIGRRRRREGGFAGDPVIRRQLAEGVARRLVGLRPEGRAPVRAGAPIFCGDVDVGRVSSGGFSPSLNAPIALGYLRTGVDGKLSVGLRERRIGADINPLPFVKKNYAVGEAA